MLVAEQVEAGAARSDRRLWHLGVLAWALLGFANVYAGIARRAYDLTVEASQQRRTITLTRTRAHHPEVQRRVAEMRMALETIDGFLGSVCDDWSKGVDHGADWPVKIMSAKHVTVTQAWSVVDNAFDVAGGAAVSRRNRLEQIFRDARLGRVHPASSMDVYEIVGKASLGVADDDGLRWG